MTKEEIGSFIKEQRKLQNLSQQELSEKSGILRRQQIMEMENNQTDFGIDVLIKVMNALGFNVSFLLPPPTFPDKSKNDTGLVQSLNLTFDFSKIVAAVTDDPYPHSPLPSFKQKIKRS